MNSSGPLISIGMPVYNEERFIREALESLVSQTYGNVEIIISDNCSTDATLSISNEFSARYKNVRVVQNQQNCGAVHNFQKVYDEARGEYFMWASGHDVWDGEFLEHAVWAHEACEASIVFGSASWIDERSCIFSKSSGWLDSRGMDDIARFYSVFWGNMNPVLGLIRCDAMKGIRLKNIVGADFLLLLELATKGDFIHSVDSRWRRREFRSEQAYKDKLKRYKSAEFKFNEGSISRFFPLLYLGFSLYSLVLKSRLKLVSKVMVLLSLPLLLPLKYISGETINRRDSSNVS